MVSVQFDASHDQPLEPVYVVLFGNVVERLVPNAVVVPSFE